MVINLWNACKQPCIILLVICRNQYLPTDSADEAFLYSVAAGVFPCRPIGTKWIIEQSAQQNNGKIVFAYAKIGNKSDIGR